MESSIFQAGLSWTRYGIEEPFLHWDFIASTKKGGRWSLLSLFHVQAQHADEQTPGWAVKGGLVLFRRHKHLE